MKENQMSFYFLYTYTLFFPQPSYSEVKGSLWSFYHYNKKHVHVKRGEKSPDHPPKISVGQEKRQEGSSMTQSGFL